MRAIMPDEIQLSSSVPNRKICLIYQYPNLESQNELMLFKKYLSSLVYDIPANVSIQLSNQDVYELKESITLLYRAYKEKAVHLKEIEGVWSLLTFRFSKISGLQLYLAFQNLAKQKVLTQSQVKQQQAQFDQVGFFHNNNNWLKDKKFIAALRVLEKSCRKPTFQSNRDECLKLLEVLIHEKVGLMVKSKEFNQEFKKFKAKVVKICRDRETIKKAILQSTLLNQQTLMKDYIMSDPGDFTHILQNFQKEDFIRIQACQHQEIKVDKDEHRVKSLFHQPVAQPQQGLSQKPITEGKLYQSTENRSSPTKKRIPQDYISNQSIQSPQLRTKRNLFRRPPRFKFIARLYNLQKENQTKENKFKEIKRQKQKVEKIKQNNLRLQKKTRKKLQKLNKNYYSDEQKPQRRRKPKKEVVQYEKDDEEEICIEESVSWSSSQELHQQRSERMSIQQSSESITMKRKRPTKNQVNVRFNNYQYQFMQAQQDQSNYRRNFRTRQRVQEYDFEKSQAAHSRNIQLIQKKRCPNLKYLGFSKPPTVQKYSESLQNLSIRILRLCQTEQLPFSINISQYMWYLQSLQPKQVKKEIIQISQQLLTRQYEQNDINMVIKILGLFIISQHKSKEQNGEIWLKFKNAFIDPLLKHCLSVTIYSGCSEILNNLTVGSFNQDISNLSKIKKYFYYLFEIVNSYDFIYKGIEQKFVKTIYELLPTPEKVQTFLKNQKNNLKITLQCAFKLGINSLKFQLSPKDQTIAFTISSFIFQQLILYKLVRQITNSQTIRKEYFEIFIKDMQFRKAESKQWLVKFSYLIKQFYNVYNPQLNETYFTSLAGLITISLSNLMTKVLETEEQSKEIKVHSEFLQFICIKYLQYQLKKPVCNKSLLLNTVIVKPKISANYKEVIPQKIQTMVIYPRILNTLWNYKEFRSNNNALYTITNKYLIHIEKALEQNSLSLKNPLVSESLSNLIKTLYKYKLFIQLTEESNRFNLSDLEKSQNSSENMSLLMLRKIILTHFRQLDKFLEEDVKYQIKNTKEPKGKSSIKMSQQMIFQFLGNLIHSKRQESSPKDEQSVLSNSISHYFFGLKFVLQQNFFQKYYKYKVQHKMDFINQFLKKCSQIINFYFTNPPNFIDRVYLQACSENQKAQATQIEDEEVENLMEIAKLKKKHTFNEQLSKQYYRLVNSHFTTRTKFQHQQQIQIINQITEPFFFTTFANIYATHMNSYLELTNHQVNLSNPIIKCVRDIAICINSKKIEKCVYFLTCVFKQIEYYLKLKENFSKQSSYSGHKTVQSEFLSKKIKRQFNQIFLLYNAKHIVTVLVCGFALKNSQDYAQMPLDKLVQSFANMELLEKQHLSHNQTDCGYLHFLYAMQCLKANGNLSDILGNLLWIGNKSPELNNGVSKMLIDLFTPLRLLLNLQLDKSIITLQSLKILIFAINWSQVSPQCIKKYLNDMQVISKGESLIQKIPITQRNVQTILQLFQVITKSKYDYYQIKRIPQIFVELVCSQQKHKQKQAFYKKIERLLLCLHQTCKNQSNLLEYAKNLTRDILNKLMEPVLKSSFTESVSVVKRLDLFCEMLKISTFQRPVYQYLVVNNKQDFQKAIQLLKPTVQKICSLQQFVQKLMINEHSAFFDLKRLISSMVEKNKKVQTNFKKESFIGMMQKMKRFMEKSQANHLLINWCEEQLKKLRNPTIIEQLSDWMDLQ